MDSNASPCPEAKAGGRSETLAKGPERLDPDLLGPCMAMSRCCFSLLVQGRKLLLHKHEMIDFSQSPTQSTLRMRARKTRLLQKDCLGSGGFGAVYRGFLGSREVQYHGMSRYSFL